MPSRDSFERLRHRWHRVLVIAGLTGILVGLAVAGFEWITAKLLLDHVDDLPLWLLVFAPGVGLLLAWCALRFIGQGTSPSTADEYLRAYHGDADPITPRTVTARVLASISTLGFGGAMGFEGPSIYLGATIGSILERRFGRFFTAENRRLLLVAGAAAGVSAIFKAPATGAVFALEVPYQEDTAAHALLPALIASSTSYLTYVAIFGIAPLLHITGTPAFDATDLGAALALGLLAGIGARLFAAGILQAKRVANSTPHWRRIALAAFGLAAITAGAHGLFDTSVTFGPGYRAIGWTLGAHRAVELIAALFVLRALATWCTVAGGGAGGVFIPLVVQGWLLGSIFEATLTTHTALFPIIGAAAFLGAGYRTPIAAIVFVAESTGHPGFIVPALLATAVSQLVMGTHSISSYQLPRRHPGPATTTGSDQG